jgi:hypothetical protein
MDMSATEKKTAYQKWLDRLSEHVKPTPKGVRLSLTLYVYPDGHGNLYFQRPDTGKLDEAGQPVNNVDEAVQAFQAVWEQAADHPK